MATEIQTPKVFTESGAVDSLPKRSAVENHKEASRQLRGTIGEELTSPQDHFTEADKQLLKFHGTYQQEDRDARKNRRKDGVGKHYMFMVRCKIPGGSLTDRQYLAVDDLAGTHANGTLRFTTRQGIQLHGVLKSHLQDTIAGINNCLLTTLGACGDVNRNVMACPAPHFHHGIHAQLQETAAVLAAHFAPRTRAYHEIWLNGRLLRESMDAKTGESHANGVATPSPSSVPLEDLEPIYGKVYLPRKFKMGLALPQDNCIDVYAQDLGLLAVVENGDILGYNVLVGGGMGMTHGNENTFPHLGQTICYVPAKAVVGAAEAVVKLFRDHGNRADRKRARIKYLVHDWGVDKFRHVLADYIGGSVLPPKSLPVRGFDPHHGWNPQGNGQWYYGLSIENGRVKDEGSLRLRSGLRALVERFHPSLRITPLQDVLLCGLDASAKSEIERTLAEFGILRPDQISSVQRYSMACPAIPTCGLAITESERVLPSFIDQLEAELKRLDLEDEQLSVRMTGCPNGCARPYQSDIGLVGRSGDKYTIFLGGHVLGTRLNFQLKDLVPFPEILPTLRPILEQFKKDRLGGESFGDYCHRQGPEKLRAYFPAAPDKTAGNGHASPSKLARPNGELPLIETSSWNGKGHAETPEKAMMQPEVPPATRPIKRHETFLAGQPGQERPDYQYRFNSDGSIRETAVYFYGDDLRASAAHAGDPLRREAVYQGAVDAFRLHAAYKRSNLYFVGSAGHERPDTRIEYHP
ncbi:MAG TPA: NADPH-dependent assimilatory sulfite reductase hemoprotein subunit, partial [Gemmataceae bacterium]|nr:NADPH-dependent assimilatory sulfite reductase hemoprotein subunit [Gemmataceae bacterium]